MPTSVDATASQAGGERVERPLRAAIAPAENPPFPFVTAGRPEIEATSRVQERA